MRKILIALLGVLLVAALAGAGTFAYFSDTETSTGNSFTAGILDLKVDGEDDPNVSTYLEVGNVAPGDSDEVTINLANAGTIDGTATIHIIGVADDDVSSNEPELAAGDLPDDPENTEDGELCDNLYLVITADLDGDGAFETAVAEGYRSAIECETFTIGALDGGGTIAVKIAWSVDDEVGNIIQSDECVFDIEFGLNQA